MNLKSLAARLGSAGILAIGVLSACSLGPPQREPSASYDLGPARAAAAPGQAIAATLLLPDVSAPGWLDGNGIVYRLNYENAARPQAYAGSRWVAPPAALLTQRLRSRFAQRARGVVTGADGVRADYVLRVDLEDFSQVFSTQASSQVALRARA